MQTTVCRSSPHRCEEKHAPGSGNTSNPFPLFPYRLGRCQRVFSAVQQSLPGGSMSKLKWFHIAAVVLTLFLWERSASIEGGILPVLKYSVAGTLTGLGLIWIGRAFASLPFRPKTALL